MKVHTGTYSAVERLKGVFKLTNANNCGFFTSKLMESSWAQKNFRRIPDQEHPMESHSIK